MSEDVPGLVPAATRHSPSDAARVLGGAADLALGTAGLAATTLASALRNLSAAAPDAPPPAPAPGPWRVRRLPGAAVGVGVDLAVRAGRAAAAPTPGFVKARVEAAGAAQRERERAAAGYLDVAVSRMVRAVLDRVDFNEVLARVDLEALLRRVDVDALIAEVDLDAAIRRIDLASVTREVMDEIDFGEIVRESTMSIGTQTVDALRFQSVRGDELLAALVDRIVGRRRRDTGLEIDDREP
jgi:hypothetical protein